MSLNIPLPAGLGDYAWLETLAQREEINQTIPLYIEADDGIEVVAVSLLCEDDLRMIYRAPGGWQLLTEYELSEDPIIHVDDLLDAVVAFVGTDARVVQKLAQELGEKLEEHWKMGFVPYSQSGKGDKFEELRQDCNCSGIDDPSIERVPGMSEIEESAEFRCHNCMSLYGIEYQGRRIDLDEVFSAEWLFTNSTPDDIVEIGAEDSFLVYSNGRPIDKTERVIGAMTSYGGDTSSSFARYIPENHQGLLYIRDDDAAGYVTWEELDGIQVLRQLYVRDHYRRRGIAEELIQTWCQEYCKDDVYYIDEPNDKSRSLFSKLGHINGDGEYEAIELYPIRGVGNSLDGSQTLPQ
ncbi:GNAT family N-acetyltransferase [Salinibaculum marinum]|uniref:GNAT family N-acetyltransferase n=1 Tax=Salinibaculum marinum TaxID=3131993 RepID=UPI0030CC269F